MTQLNPAQFRLLLAGPRVSRLLPFFTARGYVADGATSGADTIEHLRAAPRHVLLVELELGDMLLADLLRTVHGENLAGAVILLEDPVKSGLIVSTLLRGVDAYVSTPPDEAYLFRIIERQLLAQWALAQAGQQEASAQELVRLEKQMALERAKVTELVREIASLREELASARVATVNTTQPMKGKFIPGFDDDMPTAQQVPVHVNPPPMPLVRGKPAAPSLNDLDDLDPPTVKPSVTPAQRLTSPPTNTEPIRISKPAAQAPTAEELDFARGTLNDLELDDDSGAFEEPTVERTAQNAAANLGNFAKGGDPLAGLDFDDEDAEQKTRTAAMVNPAALKNPAKPSPGLPRPANHVHDESTSPAGWTPPAELRARASGPGKKDVGFGNVGRTVPTASGNRAPSVASALDEEVVFDDSSSSDLLLDLDDATAALSQPSGSVAAKSVMKPDDFMLDLDDLKDD